MAADWIISILWFFRSHLLSVSVCGGDYPMPTPSMFICGRTCSASIPCSEVGIAYNFNPEGVEIIPSLIAT